MELFKQIMDRMDTFVWGPVMLILLVGTGVFLTVRLGFRTWKNLPYSLRSVLSREAGAGRYHCRGGETVSADS